MKRILSMVMMIVITVTSFGFCSYNSNSVVSADTVSWPSGPGLVAETAVMIDALPVQYFLIKNAIRKCIQPVSLKS